MASRDDFVSLQSELSITSFEDIERMLSENNIVQEYHEHLKQVNICILMFEELETNRSYWEIFSDWTKGERDKIDCENLVKNLGELKEELLAGISIYTKLLAQKEEFKKYFKILEMKNFDSVGEETKISIKSLVAEHVPSEKEVQKVDNFGKTLNLGGIITVAVSLIFSQYKLLSPIFHAQNSTPEISMEWKEIAGSGVLCLGAGLVLIYGFAKCKEEKRTFKFQDLEKFQDTLNAELLFGVKNKNESMKKIHETIYENLHKREVIMYLANSFYSESKDKALKEIVDDEPDLTAEICEKLSKREAKIACKSYLKHEFNCSNEEAEEILSEIQSSKE